MWKKKDTHKTDVYRMIIFAVFWIYYSMYTKQESWWSANGSIV